MSKIPFMYTPPKGQKFWCYIQNVAGAQLLIAHKHLSTRLSSATQKCGRKGKNEGSITV